MRFIFLLLFPLLLWSCKDAPSAPVEEQRLSRTVLIYMAAQNSLGHSAYHRQDSTEIMFGARHLRENERILLFIDDERPPRLYEVARGYAAPRRLRVWQEDENSAAPETLSNLLSWMRDNYDSREYGLVLWSHATGWIPSGKSVAAEQKTRPHRGVSENRRQAASTTRQASGDTGSISENKRSLSPKSFGVDVGKDGNMRRDLAVLGALPDEINIPQLAAAIRQSGTPLRYILFDCCLMQCVEAAYDLRRCADYIAASPMAIPAEGGFYPDLIRNGLFATDMAELGKTYVDYYQFKGSQKPGHDMGIVFSIVRTDRLEALAAALAKVLPKAHSAADPSLFDFWDMTDTQPYGTYDSRYFFRPHYYDMNDALRRRLSPEEHAVVKSAIDAAVVFKGATRRFWAGPGYWSYLNVDLDNYCGLSMFVPQAVYSNQAPHSIHGDLNAAFRKTAWYEAAGWKAAGW